MSSTLISSFSSSSSSSSSPNLSSYHLTPSPFDQSFDLQSPSSSKPSLRPAARLPPPPSANHYNQEHSSSSSSNSRHFIAVRNGHEIGVFTKWQQAQAQIVNHPDPVYKTFSTRLAAEAFVTGWDGSGRHSLPPSSPQPLREYLAMNFPSSVPLSAPTRSRSYYKTQSSTSPHLPAVAEAITMTDFGVPPLNSTRPPTARSSSSYRKSMVRISSPLRQQVDNCPTSVTGFGGLLSPPHSPDNRSILDRERPVKPRTAENPGLWGSTPPRPSSALGMSSPPPSPTSPTSKRRSGHPVRSISAPAGLWGDTLPSPPETPISEDSSATMPDLPHVPDGAPKFSRSALKKSAVIMPVSARRPTASATSSSSSVITRSGLSGIFTSTHSSSTSVTSTSSGGSTSNGTWRSKTIRRSASSSTIQTPQNGQDRLASLAETSKAELKLNDAGLLALSSLTPPKAAFMRTHSSASISSDHSAASDSDSSFTSATSTIESPLAVHMSDPKPIGEPVMIVDNGNHTSNKEEEDMGVISCTKSDGDADGSVESSSIKKNGKTKGGLFKRFSKALGMEKKVVPGSEGRRGSL